MKQVIAPARISYLRSSNFLRTWSERQCEVCELAGVQLSLARPAPAVVHSRPVKAVPAPVTKEVPPRRKQKEDPYLNTFHAVLKVADRVSAFSDWLKSPPSPPPAKALLAPSTRLVPVFDIQDVPKAMRKLGMPMAAKLQERWFAGQENYSISEKDLMAEVDQHGKRYAPSMVDAKTITMDWVLSFSRAKRAFDELVDELLRTPAAHDALKKKLTPYRMRQDLQPWSVVNADFLEFHRRFQFQRVEVNASWGTRIAQFLVRSLNAGGVPDDLTGALGAFNLYAAVRHAWFDDAGRFAYVDAVSIYVRDPYEFSGEQYLGHWSPSHVAVVPAHQLAKGWLDYTVVDGSVYDKDSVLYPVTNKDYRDWRTLHGQGGDFMIYTDRRTVLLDSPIRVVF